MQFILLWTINCHLIISKSSSKSYLTLFSLVHKDYLPFFDYFIAGKCNQINTNINPNRKIGKTNRPFGHNQHAIPSSLAALWVQWVLWVHSLSERATWAAVAGPCKTTPGRSLVRCASLCGLFAFNLTTNHNLSFQTCWFVGQRDNVSQRQGLLIMQSARVPDNGEKNKGLKQRKDASVCKKRKTLRKGCTARKLDSRNDELSTGDTPANTWRRNLLWHTLAPKKVSAYRGARVFSLIREIMVLDIDASCVLMVSFAILAWLIMPQPSVRKLRLMMHRSLAKLDNFSWVKVSERLHILMDADGLRTLLMIFVQRLWKSQIDRINEGRTKLRRYNGQWSIGR